MKQMGSNLSGPSQMQQGSIEGTIQAVDEGVAIGQQLIPFLGLIPQLAPYIGALQALFGAISTVGHALPGATPSQVNNVVANHLTPGAPNAPVLADSGDTQNPNNPRS